MSNPPDHKIHFIENASDVFAACGASNPRNASLNTKHTTCARCRRTEIYSICESADRNNDELWGATSSSLPKTGKTGKTGKGGKGGKSFTASKGGSSWNDNYKSSYKPCYHTHPPYEVAPGITILGGSGVDPIHEDCDVYISLEARREVGPKNLPWNPGFDIVFPVRDFKVPDSAAEFRKLVDWTAEQLLSGAKVHAGCMMGHGRTGMLFAALRAVMHDPKQAIQHVRENYCKKAVDTLEQVNWLVKHFGVDTAPQRERGPYLFDKGAYKGTSAGSYTTTTLPGVYTGDTWGNKQHPLFDDALHKPRRNNDEGWFRQEGESVDDWLRRTATPNNRY